VNFLLTSAKSKKAFFVSRTLRHKPHRINQFAGRMLYKGVKLRGDSVWCDRRFGAEAGKKPMKVSRVSAVPVPEQKPAPPSVKGSGEFAALFERKDPPPPTPARKPEAPSIAAPGAPIPQQKPDPVAVQEKNAPVPGYKPDPQASQTAQIPVPDRKPDPAAFLLAERQAQTRKTAPPTTSDSDGNAAERIAAASRQVAGLSGHSYKTILAQATQESGLDPNKKSRTSSAAGPFQFLEKTWLDMFRRHGAAYGLGDMADQIKVRDGVSYVADPAMKKKILDLRHNIDVSAGMAARMLSEGKERLEQRLKRPVSETESRLAYVFGVGGALTLLRAAERSPDKPAAELLPGAAKANGPLFYDRKTGQALSVSETLARLNRKMNVDQRDMFAAIDDAAGRLRLDGRASPFNAFQTATDAPPPSPFEDEAIAESRKSV
jgi:hypothetical protein